MSPSFEREVRRNMERDYWTLVNMKHELRQLDREIAGLRVRCAAWDVILREHPTFETALEKFRGSRD